MPIGCYENKQGEISLSFSIVRSTQRQAPSRGERITGYAASVPSCPQSLHRRQGIGYFTLQPCPNEDTIILRETQDTSGYLLLLCVKSILFTIGAESVHRGNLSVSIILLSCVQFLPLLCPVSSYCVPRRSCGIWKEKYCCEIGQMASGGIEM